MSTFQAETRFPNRSNILNYRKKGKGKKKVEKPHTFFNF